MLIIGEKINGMFKKVKEAIKNAKAAKKKTLAAEHLP